MTRTLAGLLERGATLADLAAHLDGLDRSERVAQCLALPAALQKRLWQVAASAPPAAGELVGGPGAAVFAGRNSLRLLTRFEKRFARQEAVVVGYNRHTLGWLIGPGYFTVAPAPGGAGLLFDYRRLPARAPEGWPRVRSNSATFSRPVYGDLRDDVLWVTGDVLIGSARRGDAALDSYFVLARA
jgi:hypothetical protein